MTIHPGVISVKLGRKTLRGVTEFSAETQMSGVYGVKRLPDITIAGTFDVGDAMPDTFNRQLCVNIGRKKVTIPVVGIQAEARKRSRRMTTLVTLRQVGPAVWTKPKKRARA